MSSKIPHVTIGQPIVPTSSRPVPKESPRASAAKRRGTQGGAPGGAKRAGGPHTPDDVRDGDTLGGQAKDKSGDERRGSDYSGSSAPRGGTQGALLLPQVKEGTRAQLKGAAMAAQATSGQRADRAHWARILSQASPERQAVGAAVLERHQAALDAFAKIVPGLSKSR